MKLCIVGCGYVGLVSATCFAEMGNDVVCVDCDRERIETLQRGEMPIYEPGLAELVERNAEGGRLHFTTDMAEGVGHGQVVFICVGTPAAQDGSTDLSAVMSVARQIARHMDDYRLVVIKSTVPAGTCRQAAEEMRALTDVEFDVASNPEFLKEGAAVDDFFRPDRVIVGADSESPLRTMKALYAPFLRTGRPLLAMSTLSAEMTKQAANTMLAVRISLINELAGLCEATGADVEEVRLGMAADRRIGSQFLFPGLGFGGSCLPKDIRSLADVGRSNNHPMHIAEAAHQVNMEARERFLRRIAAHFEGDLNGRTLAFWGLAFKPRTDDVREAPAIWLMQRISERWPEARLRGHDPEANARARAALGDCAEMFEGQYEPLDGADALVICTDWNEFRSPDFERIAELLKEALIFDGRNLYDPEMMRELGISYYPVGRPPVHP